MEEFKKEKDHKIELASMMNRMKVKKQSFFDDVFIVNIGIWPQNQEHLSSLSQFQKRILSDIVSFADNPNFPNLFFLQGKAWTGKTFLTNTLINTLGDIGTEYFMSATKGIAASQNNGSSTIHSLFHLSIDQEKRNDAFTSNIEKNTFAALVIICLAICVSDNWRIKKKKKKYHDDQTIYTIDQWE